MTAASENCKLSGKMAWPAPDAIFANSLSADAMTALVIRGGTVVNADHSRRADVPVDGETIVAIGCALDAPAGAQTIDAGGCYVMPGGIDPHTDLELAFMGSVSADDFDVKVAKRHLVRRIQNGATDPFFEII